MDPFAVFGDDSSDDGTNNEATRREPEADRIVQSLISLANSRATSLRLAPSIEVAGDSSGDSNGDCDEITLPWPKPLYTGRIKKVASLPFGGGRGCIADQELAPGTLVLVEQALVTWSVDDNQLDLRTILSILAHDQARDIVQALEHFHPTKQVVDSLGADREVSDEEDQQIIQMLDMLRNSYHADRNAGNGIVDEHDTPIEDNSDKITEAEEDESPTVPLLLDLAATRQLVHADGSPITERDIWRLVLAIRYNGLESGIYLYAALLNHADQPNCVKFRSDTGRSEVRTTRTVPRGQALTISYLPRIVSHASRRRHLWEQHRFDIRVPTASVTSPLYRMELIGNKLPPSSWHKWDEASTTHRIELSIAGLESIYQEALSTPPSTSTEADVAAARFEHVKALEQACLELCIESEHQLQNPRHVLLLPCFRLHVDACDLVQQCESLNVTDRLALLIRLVTSGQRLWELQNMWWGPDHFDVARTSLDVAQAIEELLTRSPRHLQSLSVPGGGPSSPSAWSAYEYQLSQNYQRIQALYPRDASDYISPS